MGFLNGRVSWERFEVGGKAVPLGDPHVGILERYSIDERLGTQGDGVSIGFVGGDHVLDLQFSREKNLVNDALHAAVRIDAFKVPGELKKAWIEMEIAERAADNPSGFPTRNQKQEAKEAVEERIQEDAKDGRFKTMKHFPFLWDSRQEVLYLGSSSESVIEKFVPIFEEAFDRTLTRMSAGGVAHDIAKQKKQTRSFEDLAPAAFFGAANKSYSVSWLGDGNASRDFLGNEFLLWLWWIVEGEADSVKLPDDSTVAAMMSRTLSLECPLAETGKETISHESPIKLPEAKHAVRLGKLPRKSGLTLNRHDEQYDLTLTAETLAVSSAALPKLDSDTFAQQRQDRVDQVRHLTETIDLLFTTFVQRRLSSQWPSDLKRLRAWLKEE